MLSPLLQAYVYGAVPPVVLTNTEPSDWPQFELTTLSSTNPNTTGSPTVALAVAVHPLASVIVTL